MEVILLERVEKLGQMGDVVSVKPGFARNYLLPQKKALRATEANKTAFDAQKAQLEAENLKRKSEAEDVAAKMADLKVTMIRQAGEAGQLYGSVNARDIANGVTDAGFTVSRSQVSLASPIKTLGLFPVAVALHPEVAIDVTVNVARSSEEAKIQAETGTALISKDEEEEAPEAVPAAEEIFEEEVLAEQAAEEEAEEATEAEEAPAEEAAEEEETKE